MNYKNPNTDTGSYVNGKYTSKNGFSDSGLNCPKGTRLYDQNAISPIMFLPENRSPDEEFRMITEDAAPDILPYYGISNQGKIINIYTGKIMKENYRPNGYGYYCLAADNCKNNQKKYSSHRMVIKTFNNVENSNELEVNHIDGNKKNNFLSNLEWTSHKENAKHRSNISNMAKFRYDWDAIKDMREMHDQGYSYVEISKKYDKLSVSAIQNICLNKTFTDPNYILKDNYYLNSYKTNPANIHKLTDNEANLIRKLYKEGYKYKDIKEKFFPDFSIATISDINRGITHNR